MSKTLKVIGWAFLSIVSLLLVLIAVIQIPAVQDRITHRAIAFLEEKIGTRVELASLYISFPKNIVIKGLFLEDQLRDTLLYAGKVSINTDLWALIQKEIQLNKIELQNTTAFVKRAEGDTLFNYSYILKAFAGDSTAVPDTLEEQGWNFTLKTIEVANFRAHYHDKLTGNDLDAALGLMKLSMDVFDLTLYRFGVEDFRLENTFLDLRQSKIPEVTADVAEASTDTMTLDLDFGEITLENVRARYSQTALEQEIMAEIGKSFFEGNRIDLRNRLIDLREIQLSNSSLSYQQLPGKTVDVQPVKPVSSSSQAIPAAAFGQPPPPKNLEWRIKIDRVDLEDNTIRYSDFRKPHTKGSVDPDHLHIASLNLNASGILVHGSDIRTDLQNLSFSEKSGFVLRRLQSSIRISDDSASMTGFILQTGNSRLNCHATAVYDSFEGLAENFADAFVRADITTSHVGMQDLFYFNPVLRDSLPLKLSPSMRVFVDGSLSGKVNNLSLHHLNLNTLSDTHLKTAGTFVGLPDMDRLNVDISLDRFYTTRSDVMALLPDTLLPDSLAPPEWISLSGEYKGNSEQAGFRMLCTTDIGSVALDGNIDLDSTSVTRGFDGRISVNEFDVGALLMQEETIGTLDLRAAVSSEGLTPEEMNSAFEATVGHFEYEGYTYNDLRVSATVKDRILNGWASLEDANLEFALKGDVNFQDDVPRYDFTFDLRNADFKALGLAERPLKARGTLEVDLATADLKVLNGNVGIRKVAIFNGDDLYAVDSLLFASIDQEGRSEITIDSDIMEGRFEGTINIFTMPAVVREYFNTYYELHDSVEQSYEGPQRFTFDLDLKKTELITGILIPDLHSFEPGEIRGAFDSKAQQLDLHMNVSQIKYANVGVRSLVIRTNSDSTELNYNVLIDEVMVDSMRIDGLEFNGTVADDSIRTNIVIRDSADVYKYVLAGTFFSRDDAFELRLDPDDIRLNYAAWSVPQNNFIRFGADRLVAENVELTNGREKIIIESKPQPGAPLLIAFRELNLEYLTSMISREKPVSGLLHGDINLYTDEEKLQFTSAIGIKNLVISDRSWGDLALSVEQRITDRFDVDFTLAGKNNDIRAQGYYTGGASPAMDLNAVFSRFDLSVLEPMLKDQAEKLKGTLTGELHAGGSPQQPDIDGRISLRNAGFFSTFLRTAFSIENESILFDQRGILFDQFALVDENKNTATVDGLIRTANYRDFAFELDVNTRRFQLLNTGENDNDLFYGRININANARIRGTMINPDVDMEVSLTEGDHFTYIVPQAEAAILEQQGIVRFVDKTFKGDPFMKRVQSELSDTVKSTFRGIDLTAKVELTDRESLTIIIDPTTDDQLTVKGNTTLTLQMDRTGDIRLAGRYEISEGTYNLSFYKFVRREFSIEKGSSMTWSGDPLNAAMDITAIFAVETSPVELLSNQITSPEDLNRYRQRLPFHVYLNIDGQLLKPEISFRLEMPMDERNALGGNVYARLMDINTRESDLNKQVFALLILKRFIADNPFENQGASGFEGTARSSVSKILTEQLNKLSENIKGVELSFDVKSYQDYAAGTGEGQTELQLGLSKRLLDDRLVVKLSGNVDIEGQNANREVTDYIGDLAIEYLLTEDGRFRITGFRNSNYDMIDGELTETGAGLIYIKDYNTLQELFKANAKD